MAACATASPMCAHVPYCNISLWVTKEQRLPLARIQQSLQASCGTHIRQNLHRGWLKKKGLEAEGIDPPTSRMQSERSTI